MYDKYEQNLIKKKEKIKLKSTQHINGNREWRRDTLILHLIPFRIFY